MLGRLSRDDLLKPHDFADRPPKDGWKPPRRLEPWERPFSDPVRRLPQQPQVAAERRPARAATQRAGRGDGGHGSDGGSVGACVMPLSLQLRRVTRGRKHRTAQCRPRRQVTNSSLAGAQSVVAGDAPMAVRNTSPGPTWCDVLMGPGFYARTGRGMFARIPQPSEARRVPCYVGTGLIRKEVKATDQAASAAMA
jgi:hypothetical protein